MKKIIFLILYAFIILACSQKAETKGTDANSAQVKKDSNQVNQQDSIAACELVSNFYSWYAKAINADKQKKDLYPQFVKTENGMSSLYMEDYVSNLRRWHFSEKLIEKTINNYRSCIDNLEKINYDTLTIKYTSELGEMEQINCDYSNSYEWIKDMEAISGVDIVKVSKIKTDFIVKVMLYDLYSREKQYRTYKHVNVKVVKNKDQWLIDDIDIVFTR